MAVSTRVSWSFTGLLVLILSTAIACGDSGKADDDDMPPAPDAMVPVSECAMNCDAPGMCCTLQGADYCIDTSRDMFNCGGCGQICSEDVATVCGGSECKCGASPACTNGKTCISALVGCRDMKTDPQNCGSKGHKCAPEETCSDGVCSCGGMNCEAGTTCCGGTCTNTHTDAENCGVCHNVCEADQNTCTNGVCGCAGGGTCNTTPTYNNVGKCCGAGCSNLCTDAMNCGECGHICSAGATCNLGGCSNENNPDPFLCTIFP
jgi:hypothetical protein